MTTLILKFSRKSKKCWLHWLFVADSIDDDIDSERFLKNEKMLTSFIMADDYI
jgi:hypothetical protein